MAYPNPIPSTSIGVTKDFLDYFKECLIDYVSHEFSEDYYSRWVSFISEFQALPALPISRANFYLLIRNNFPAYKGEYLYNYSEPSSGWSIRVCNDWGKLKTIEQALFGNTTGASGNSMASVNGTKFLQSIPKWQSASMSYLRYGLCRFTTYGAGIVPELKRPAPTNLVYTVSNRGFNWTNATGFPALTDYEYKYLDGLYNTVTSKPIIVPGNKALPVGGLDIRTKGDGYVNASDSIKNTIPIPYNAMQVSILYCNYNAFGPQGEGIYTTFLLSESLSAQINIRYEVITDNDLRLLGLTNINAGLTTFNAFMPYTFSIPNKTEGKIIQVTPNPVGNRYIIWD